MRSMLKNISALALSLATTAALAAPAYFITHNQTDVESNAYVLGVVPSPRPTAANSEGKVSWNVVKLACAIYSSEGVCTALVKMATNTPNPVELGYVSLNVDTGDLSPKELRAGGYTLMVNGPGEVTLMKD